MLKHAVCRFRDSGYKKILFTLLALDAVFVALHVMYLLAYRDPNLMLHREGGYAERFQYLKELSIVLMVGFLALRRRSFRCLSWTMLFLYVLLDDSLAIHERTGRIVSEALGFSPMLGLRAQDFGELTVTSVFALLFAGLLLGGYRFCRDPVVKKLSVYLLIMLVLLALAGVALDMAHAASPEIWLLNVLLTIAEDGGEMVVMSGIVWLVLLFVKDDRSVALASGKKVRT